ncbi:hypothetical protein IAR55_003843 [Kwoniella newhampshirensis]|uniref:Uncharacterized protein n=1 Tax=Kwoniella newhampshirensis TaxID=1651941 RepID=A0AAW0YYC3_9TREE
MRTATLCAETGHGRRLNKDRALNKDGTHAALLIDTSTLPFRSLSTLLANCLTLSKLPKSNSHIWTLTLGYSERIVSSAECSVGQASRGEDWG